MQEEADIFTTRVTSALSLRNTVTAVMGTSLLENVTVRNSGAGTVGEGAVGEEEEEEEEAMLTYIL